jgi:hypothetical protein
MCICTRCLCALLYLLHVSCVCLPAYVCVFCANVHARALSPGLLYRKYLSRVLYFEVCDNRSFTRPLNLS